MNQTANLSAAIKAAWLANATLPGLVPGGLLYGLQKAGSARPFASLLIALDGEPEYMTGRFYIQAYRVTVRVWSGEKIGDAGAIQAALETLIAAESKFTLTNNAWTLHVSLEPAAMIEDEERFCGQFTFIAGATWLIQLQEQRS